MEFTKETILDNFHKELEAFDTIFILPDVKNVNGSIIFSLVDLGFKQPNIMVAPEKKLKRHIKTTTPEIVHHLIIDDSKRDTLDIHIEEYALGRKKILIFNKLIRYWICKGIGTDFIDGRFVFNSEKKAWHFISGRQQMEQYWKKLYSK